MKIKKKIYLLLFSSFLFITAINCKNQKDKKPKYKSEFAYALEAPADSLPSPSNQYKKNKHKEIEDFLKQYFEGSFENLSFLVAKDGHIIYEKYDGFADKEKNKLMTANSPLHIASISKVMTASVILKLIDYKKITLDQKVNTILVGFPYPDVTIRSLLNHRSGLKKYNYFCDDDAIWGRHKNLTNANLLTVLKTKKIPQETKTGTHFSYNNTNFALLALVIEKITGMKYATAMKKLVFEPLEMKNTYVVDENSPKEKSTPSYTADYKKFPFEFLDYVYGDKNIYSTPRDLLKFDQARCSKTFLSKQLLNQVFKGYSYESKGEKNYGLGIRMREWKTGQKLFYHNGWWHGNTAVYVTMRKEGATIIAISNKFTKKVFQVKRLSVLFGDYPFKLNDSLAKEE